MSSHALIVSLLFALAVTAAAARAATGPLAGPKDGQTLYALAKSGPYPAAPAVPVELAARTVGPGR